METKVFISHRSSNKVFADMIETFLTKNGISTNEIFCSSLPGNDIQQTISLEIKQALKQSIIDIVILSDEFYDSAYCQNELGVIWFKDNTVIIPICLPEINSDTMLGFLNSEYKIRRLDNKNDIHTVCDSIKSHFSSFITSSAKLNSNIDQLINTYNIAIEKRIVVKPQIISGIDKPNELEQKILSGDFSDDELIFFKYLYDSQTNFIYDDFQLVLEWMRKNDIQKELGEHPTELLIEEGLMEYGDRGAPGEYDFQGIKLQIKTYRELRKISERCIQYIDDKLSNFKSATKLDKVNGNQIDVLINNGFSENELLLIKYIFDTESKVLLTGWQTEMQEQSIIVWEELQDINDKLRKNYGEVLTRFEVRKFIDVSKRTSYGNPKEYTIRDTIFNMIMNINNISRDKLKKLSDKNKAEKISFDDVEEDDDLPF